MGLTCTIYICGMTHLYVWHEIGTREIHSYPGHDSLRCRALRVEFYFFDSNSRDCRIYEWQSVHTILLTTSSTTMIERKSLFIGTLCLITNVFIVKSKSAGNEPTHTRIHTNTHTSKRAHNRTYTSISRCPLELGKVQGHACIIIATSVDCGCACLQ